MKFVKSIFGLVLMCSFNASAGDTPTIATPVGCMELSNVTISHPAVDHLVFVIKNAGLGYWEAYQQIEKAIMGYSKSTGYQCTKTYSKTTDDLVAHIDCRLAE